VNLLAVDPGIDVTGVAVFDVADLPAFIGWSTLSDRLVVSGSIKTPPSQQLWERIGDLAEGLTELIEKHSVRWVAIERPATHGTYQRNRSKATTADGFMPATMASMYLATGGLVGAAMLRCCKVWFVPASKVPKRERSLLVRSVWPRLGRTNADQRDAIYLGGVTILDNRRRWVA